MTAMQDLWQIEYSFLIPLLPLLGACAAGFFGAKFLKQRSHWPIWLGVGGAAVISISLLLAVIGVSHHHESEAPAAPAGHLSATPRDSAQMNLSAVKNYFSWISIGDFNANWGYFFDPLTCVMLCVVCGIGFFICVFAAGYMKGEAGYFRFFAYLGLFIFMMTNLVMGENLIMLYLGWEGVGLCSYLLIGYYYEKPSAREAAKKAFLVNRVGDFGFGLGIMLAFKAFGTVSYFGDGAGTNTGLLEMALSPNAEQAWALTYIPFLLMLGAFGKSAQFPLHVWLPDAMEGPTPVSALIHAATMVTAGVYMIARCSTLFLGNDAAMWTIAIIGAFTAIFAGTIALRQFDLKKVFAYSTVSQLGFMFVGVGVLAPVAGVFHLVTHAFFKALLFLSSGVVMHAMMGELDLRKMSGLKRQLPKTRILMLIGCLALAGFPLTSGYFSKDEIIHYAHERSLLIYAILSVTAFLTAYYTFRLYFRVFEGPEVIPDAPAGDHGHGGGGHGHDDAHSHGAHDHDDHAHHNHEPMVMILPLTVLAIGALFAGLINLPTHPDHFGHKLGHFLGQSPSFSLGYFKAKMANGDFEAAARGDEGHHYVDPIPFGQPFAAEQFHFPLTGLLIGGAIAIAGILTAYVLHLKDRARAERLAAGMPGVTRALDAKYWVDEIYQNGIVEPLRSLGRAFFAIDRWVVDGLVWLISFVPQLSGFALKLTTQRGYLQGYAAVMLLGVAVILMVIFL
ncbi:MAG: NADH-quinone oxidoreductase subunit L [Tepidisphaeraceae bacterium]